MVEEQAEVVRVENGQVWIKSLQAGACGGCMQKSACGAAALSKLLPKREFAVDCQLDLQVGDHVLVAIDDAHLLSTSLLMYILPVLAMLGIVSLASFVLPAAIADIWLPVIALIAVLLSFFLIHKFQGIFLLHFCFSPQIVGTAPSSTSNKSC
jgi:sigma-E factor negative regulatory protein RseC